MSRYSELGGEIPTLNIESQRQHPNRLHQVSEYNSSYYLLRAIWLYSHHGEYNSNKEAEKLGGINSRVEFNDESWRNVSRILGSQGLRRVSFHVLEAEAITLLIARVSLGLSLGSAVRHLEDLCSFGVIQPSLKLLRPQGIRGGRRVLVYTIPNAEGWRVEAVCKLHRRLENPLYPRALELAERILLTLSRDNDVSYGDVVEAIKPSSRASDVPALAEAVARILLERGIRVWK